jgi:hypothetical protein
MKTKNLSYPHPVLGNEDDFVGDFVVSCTHSLRGSEIRLLTKHKVTNDYIANLIQNGDAMYVTEVECPSTFYRVTYTSDQPEATYIFDSDKVRASVIISFKVRAKRNIENYEPDGVHADYEGFTPKILAGDILATGGSTTIIAEKDFDPMKPAVSSLIAIKPGAMEKAPLDIDFSQDKILIILSIEDYNNFNLVKNRMAVAGILHAAVVLPVLAEAIRLVGSEDGEELQGTHWFMRLEIIVKQRGLSLDEPLIAAQDILKNPIERCLTSLVDEEEEII